MERSWHVVIYTSVNVNTGDEVVKSIDPFRGVVRGRTRAFGKGGNGPMFHVCVMMNAWLTVGYGDRGVEVRSRRKRETCHDESDLVLLLVPKIMV